MIKWAKCKRQGRKRKYKRQLKITGVHLKQNKGKKVAWGVTVNVHIS
jgi:hypothetical protein